MLFNQYVIEILEASMKCVDTSEVISTEELLAKVDRINLGLMDARMCINLIKSMLASLDVEALYLSLDVERYSKICGEYVVN